MSSLTVCIPSRNEEWLTNTIDDVLANSRGDTTIIVTLDGAWPVHPIPDHPRVHLIYHPTSIGQRAAMNEAVRVAQTDFVMKVDAHVSFTEGFDEVLMRPYQTHEIGMDTTTIPAMTALHLYDYICLGCGERSYQGPRPARCEKCQHPHHTREVIWKHRPHRLTHFWRYDTEPHFQYWTDYKRRPEAQGDICDVMTSIGACFLMPRQRYVDLGGMDESLGSWGSFGISIANMSWLSGGRHVVNKRAIFAHAFRTKQGPEWGFPYPMSQKQAECAKKRSREIWFGNRWPKQTRSVLWLIEKFRPLPDFHDASGSMCLAELVRADAEFSLGQKNRLSFRGQSRDVGNPGADETAPVASVGHGKVPHGGQQVSAQTVGLSSLSPGHGVATQEVGADAHQPHMRGIDAVSHITDVVQYPPWASDGPNQRPRDPCIPDRMDEALRTRCPAGWETQSGVASIGPVSSPLPTPSVVVDVDRGEQSRNLLAVQVGNCQDSASHVSTSCVDAGLGAALCGEHKANLSVSVPQRGIVTISDSHAPPQILAACRNRLFRASEGIPIISVTLEPIAFGRNVVLPLTRSRLTMLQQWLRGLQETDADIVYLVEHDDMMPPEHFCFIPPRLDRFYYNANCVRVDAVTGRAVTYDMQSVSGLCADRSLLLSYYQAFVADVEAHGYDHRHGYEPGVREGLADTWRSEIPYIDIRHGQNLTASRWSPAEFRDQSTCRNFREVDEIPGWGRPTGRFDQWLQEQW